MKKGLFGFLVFRRNVKERKKERKKERRAFCRVWEGGKVRERRLCLVGLGLRVM